ncbi:hypothetical protein QR680_013350 [Steinernema hermaphroditum]|uniref:Protein-tyrosine-phosphatase n=1 Tax=Steinernema hermaphroditum TaxID=289476 RepID=A0AA39M2C7_9BILA|nr:hypothetical protein QR680_013350 [Steinernema hermaphroditum]
MHQEPFLAIPTKIDAGALTVPHQCRWHGSDPVEDDDPVWRILSDVRNAIMKKIKRPSKHEKECAASKTGDTVRQKAKTKRANAEEKDKRVKSDEGKVKRSTGGTRRTRANRRTLEEGEAAAALPENDDVNREAKEPKVMSDRIYNKEKKEKKPKKEPNQPPSTTTDTTNDVDAAPRSQFLMLKRDHSEYANVRPMVVESDSIPQSQFVMGKKEPSDRKSRSKSRKKRTYIEEDRVEDDHEVKAEPKDDLPMEMKTDTEATQKEKNNATENRSKWVLAVARRKLRPLVKEFAENRKFLPKDLSTDCFHKNTTKNRYADVYCTDHSRVVLRNREEDYIHANWVVIPNSSQKYICTQGPLEETLEDFWHMVIQERVQIIVMLCAVVEGGSEKCAQYWPLCPGELVRCGNISIRNEKVMPVASIECVRCTTLEVKTKNERLIVTHYQWADWPDHLAPNDPKTAVDLLKLCKQTAGSRPIIVHCSAGIGRTGTFCGIDFASERIKANSHISMIDVMKEMRQQRVHCIQTTLQYLYLHSCVFEYFIKCGYVKPDSALKAFTRDYEKYLNTVKSRLPKEKEKDDGR